LFEVNPGVGALGAMVTGMLGAGAGSDTAPSRSIARELAVLVAEVGNTLLGAGGIGLVRRGAAVEESTSQSKDGSWDFEDNILKSTLLLGGWSAVFGAGAVGVATAGHNVQHITNYF